MKRIIPPNLVWLFALAALFASPSLAFANPPDAYTYPAWSINRHSVTLQGVVDPRGLPTTVYFQHAQLPSSPLYYTTIEVATITAEKAFSHWVNGLTPGRKYTYRIVASNADGWSYGASANFTTLPDPLTFSTLPPEPGSRSVRLGAHVSPNGVALQMLYFEVGPTTAYTSGFTPQIVNIPSEGDYWTTFTWMLSPDTTYHCRAVLVYGEYDMGYTRYGPDVLFTTKKEYTVSASAGSGGHVTPTIAEFIEEGRDRTFTAVPDAGFEVDHWILDGLWAQTGGTTFQLRNIRTNTTLGVFFRSVSTVTHTVVASAGPGGDIQPTDSLTVPHGASQLFTALPEVGYIVQSWELDGVVVQLGQTNYTLANVTSDHALLVNFEAPTTNYYAITATSGNGGGIEPNGFVLAPEGSAKFFTATPHFGFEVAEWMLDGTTVQTGGTDYTLTNVTADHNVLVTFIVSTNPPVIVQEPQDQMATNTPLRLTVTVSGSKPLVYYWFHNGVLLPHRRTATLTITNVQMSDTGVYLCIVTNSFGSVTSRVANLTFPISLDSTFNSGADGDVLALAVQPDGKILVGGAFDYLGPQRRYHIGRLHPDGTLDSTFDPRAGGVVRTLVVQADSRILVGGSFTTLGGQTRNRIGRLNADGTLDNTFAPGADGEVLALVVQTDGKIVVGGNFATLGGQTRTHIGRLNADGTLDSIFHPEVVGFGADVRALALQADGKIVVGGSFSTLDSASGDKIARLNTDGTVDTTFIAGRVNGPVNLLAVQSDGKILVAGAFSLFGGYNRCYLFGRLNTDGRQDGFDPNVNNYVYSLAVQTDGKILVGGDFTWLRGSRDRLGRLNPDGTQDPTFNPAANGPVRSLVVQPEGMILAGGSFTSLAGQTCYRIGRLTNSHSATQSLVFNGCTITWLRGGTSSEAWRTTFESSTDGIIWDNLGIGTRIPGGWQLANVSLPVGATIRARGYVTGGDANASSWFVESTLVVPPQSPPSVVVNDRHFGVVSNRFGFNVRGSSGQTIVVEGSSNLLNWLPVQTNTLNSDTWYFTDPDWSTSYHRFYRARNQ